jgi:hypothetical protein
MLYEFKIIGGQVDKNNVWLKLAYLGAEETRVHETARKLAEF